MIRIMVVDDHPAVRAGLQTVIEGECSLVAAGAAASEHELWPMLYRVRPDVVLLDYHLPGNDGLTLCRQIKATAPPLPAVMIYSAYAGADLAVPAVVAGADGLIHKQAAATELFDAIRQIAHGTRVLPELSAQAMTRAAELVPVEDRPILAMCLSGSPLSDIAQTLRLAPEDLSTRVDRILGRLRVGVSANAA
jgi:DNA-binding NarL/FixJ family response regulator